MVTNVFSYMDNKWSNSNNNGEIINNKTNKNY